MNKKIRLRPYSFAFISHVRKFILTVDSSALDRKLFVGLSGGVDSVALAYCCYLLWKFGQLAHKPEFIHINHGTRAQCFDEAKLLEQWSKELEVKIHIVELNMSLDISDFENQARIKRYEAFCSITNSPVLLGHHLDDSFEWSLMQKLKSSHARKSLGIPVLTAKAFRPFMCVTKDHIKRFATEQGLVWFEDQSNNNLSFERNYIRRLIHSSIRPRYPKYLKHYVNQSNEMAKIFNVSVFKQVGSVYEVFKREWGLVVKVKSSNLDQRVKELVLSQSNIKRGLISSQIEKLIAGYANKKKGPYSFSGGVKVYCFGDLLLVVRKNKQIKTSSVASQIPDAQPILSLCKKYGVKKSISPFQVQMDELIGRGICFDYSWRSANSKVIYWI